MKNLEVDWMGRLRWTLAIVSTLLMIGTLGMMASAVDWTDTLTDDADDVTDLSGNTIADRESVDIISVTLTEDGDDINVTLTLAGEYNSTGIYTVYLEADGSDTYTLMRMFFLGFSASDDDSADVPVTGYYSADGTKLSWVIAKADLTVSTALVIDTADTFLVDLSGSSAMDDAGSYTPSGEMMMSSIFFEAEFEKINKLVLTVSITYEDESAKEFRMMMDENSDGTVSADEVQTIIDAMSEDDDDEDDPITLNMTIDGEDYKTVTSKYKLEGVPGPTDSTDKLKIVMTETVTWPELDDKDTHTYAFEQGDDFIGGDEPWEDEVDITFRMIVPDGWVLETDGLPSGMDDFIKDGNTIEYKNEELGADFNSTFGQVDELVIKKDESPGFGLTLALGATLLVAVVVGRRRR